MSISPANRMPVGFLGKEAIENIVYFRFANSFLEPIWNRNYVASVEITLAEAFGVDGRGRFYEGVGCLHDVVQNHLLQIVSLLAMEPPVSTAADALRDEKVKVLQAIRPLKSADIVRGQFESMKPGHEQLLQLHQIKGRASRLAAAYPNRQLPTNGAPCVCPTGVDDQPSNRGLQSLNDRIDRHRPPDQTLRFGESGRGRHPGSRRRGDRGAAVRARSRFASLRQSAG